jgi:hypothetical protein
VEIALFLQGREANLLSRVLDEVKTTIFEKSETSLSDKEALEVLVSYFENAKKVRTRKRSVSNIGQPIKQTPFSGAHYR